MTNSILQLFDFGSNQGRYSVDEHGDFWFALTDVLAMYSPTAKVNVARALVVDYFGDGGINYPPVADSRGQVQETIFIHESAVSFLISRSRTEMGKKLNRFIHLDLLPTIRKTGGYIAPSATPEQLQALHDQISVMQSELDSLNEQNKILASHHDRLAFVSDFLDCNIEYVANKYIESQDVFARFLKWAELTTAEHFTKTELLMLVDEVLKNKPNAKHNRAYIKKGNVYGDIENAQIVALKAA